MTLSEERTDVLMNVSQTLNDIYIEKEKKRKLLKQLKMEKIKVKIFKLV